MSEDQLRAFWSRIEADEALRTEFDALFEDAGGHAAAASTEILALASGHGFEFTEDELKAHFATEAETAPIELSEVELASVAGGYMKLPDIVGESLKRKSGLPARIVTRPRLIVFDEPT